MIIPVATKSTLDQLRDGLISLLPGRTPVPADDKPLLDLMLDDDDLEEIVETAMTARWGKPIDIEWPQQPHFLPVLKSLSLLAPIWPRAASQLQRRDSGQDMETLASIAASIDAARYVPSGIRRPLAPAGGRKGAVWRILRTPAQLGTLPFAVFVMSAFENGFENALREDKWQTLFLIAGLIFLVATVVRLIPGIVAVWREDA